MYTGDIFMRYMIKLKDLLFEVLEGIPDESSEDTDLAQKFCNEFLQHYEIPSSGFHNCAWVTQEFIKWAKEKGINSKAIYFVWPDKPDGESHIAPIVNDMILDFTYNQFDKTFNDCVLLTKVNDWKTVYHKFGYGTNTVNVNGKEESVIIDTFDNLKNMKEIGGLSTIMHSKRIMQ